MPIVDVLPKEVRFQNVAKVAGINSIPEWEAVIASFIATRELIHFSSFYLDETPPESANMNLLLGLQKRVRECAHFSKKLSEEDRALFISQADTLLDLVRAFWKNNPERLQPLEAAVADSQKYLDDFKYAHRSGVLGFEEA
jgi:hypothetical protein